MKVKQIKIQSVLLQELVYTIPANMPYFTNIAILSTIPK